MSHFLHVLKGEVKNACKKAIEQGFLFRSYELRRQNVLRGQGGAIYLEPPSRARPCGVEYLSLQGGCASHSYQLPGLTSSCRAGTTGMMMRLSVRPVVTQV